MGEIEESLFKVKMPSRVVWRTDRQTNTSTHLDADINTDRHTQTHRERHTQRHTHISIKHAGRRPHRPIRRHTDVCRATLICTQTSTQTHRLKNALAKT